MPSVVIDAFDVPAPWAARTPANAPSSEIVLAADAAVHAGMPGAASVRLSVTTMATQHFITRSLPSLDVRPYRDLLLWYRSGTPADGSAPAPFRLRVELGSAALAIGAPGNTWHRYLPADRADDWHLVRMGLDDLTPAVAAAVNSVRLTCVDADPPFEAWLDHLLASDPQFVSDASAALAALLDGILVIGGGPGAVPARVHVPGAPTPPAPWIRIVAYDAAFADRRSDGQRSRTDFTDSGFRIRSEAPTYDLSYRIEAVSADPVEHTAMVQFVLATLGARRTLVVDGAALPLERRGDEPDDAYGNTPTLRYRIATRDLRGTHQAVVAATQVNVDVDHGS